jgi:DNA primase
MKSKNLVDVVSDEGIQLARRGKVFVGHCPFHEDKHPSFTIYPNSNHFVCFGCGEKGDAIDFIRKLKGLTFKEACKYLKIDMSQKNETVELNKRKLISAFRRWVKDYHDELCTNYRAINAIMANVKTVEEAEGLAPLYHRLPVLEYHLDLLAYGDDAEKLELFKDVML